MLLYKRVALNIFLCFACVMSLSGLFEFPRGALLLLHVHRRREDTGRCDDLRQERHRVWTWFKGERVV